jgi:polar amino acid transport system permease protein
MDWYIVWDYRAALLDGLLLTVEISAIAIVTSTIVGAVVGCLRILPLFLPQRVAGAYVEVLRNLPLLVKLFFLYFVLGVDAFVAGLLAITLHQSAFISDVTVAGLRSIPQGQTEAARSCGHTYTQVFRYILLPQAVRSMIPALTTQYVQVVKDSAVVMLVALQELTFMTQKINQTTFRGFEAATASTVLYLVVMLLITLGMNALQRCLEPRT